MRIPEITETPGQTGITLVEVLISLSILAIGLLSLLHYSASSVKELSENNPRALALNIATESMVPIYIDANSNDADKKTQIKNKIEALLSSSAPVTSGSYKIYTKPTSVINGDGTTELISGTSMADVVSWVSPLSLGLKVEFVDRMDSNEKVTIIQPFTIVF